MKPIVSEARGGTGALFKAIAEAAHGLGTPQFVSQLLGVLKALIAHDMAMVVRYARASAPDILVCDGLSHEVVDSYRSDYYTYDPFFIWSRRCKPRGVVTFRDVAPPGTPNSRYRRGFQRQAGINDELGMFLPGVGRLSLALFLERSSGWFSAREIQLAKQAYPAFAGLYWAHLEKVLSDLASRPGSAGAGVSRAVLVVDENGMRVAESRAWTAAEAADTRIAGAVAAAAPGEQELRIGNDHVVSCDRFGPSFSLAPAGRVFVLESGSHSLSPKPAQDPVTSYWPELTARETQIVRLILDGEPSSAIATRLGITHGTVKNHRARIYEKLAVASERELFSAYLTAIGRSSAKADQS